MVPEIKTILYISDIEKGSRPAFRSAVSLATAHQARIVFLHVVEPLHTNAVNIVRNIIGRDELHALHQEGLEHIKATMRERIDRFWKEESLPDGQPLSPANLDYRVHEGIVWEEVQDTVEEVSADLIVMGCRRHHKLNTLGSIAHSILNHSHIPVHIVPL
ncbi:universal stress protein [Oceanospirillum sanctuarii]|uniref:universal stress protein n=1 Tax=Oceanospirillum sanctuarii TaxID=1434821 RepID=UPI000A3D2A19|nr:universal stress protein [Oceanospirillum sanctuarii]